MGSNLRLNYMKRKATGRYKQMIIYLFFFENFTYQIETKHGLQHGAVLFYYYYYYYY